MPINRLTNKQIEELELKHLNKIYHLLKYMEEEVLLGLYSKEKIKTDWQQFWNSSRAGVGMSDFDRGAERIIYSILNGKIVGWPNSSPVGSDLMFETSDAFIHIDLKTINTKNIGDGNTSIFIGENQNSYKGRIIKSNNNSEDYLPHLPIYYQEGTTNQKICLSYFVVIVWDKTTLKILAIYLLSMPNGQLKTIYGNRPLKAGKNPGKARFNFAEVSKFETLHDDINNIVPSRVKVVHFNERAINQNPKIKNKLNFLKNIYYSQKNS